MNLLWFTWKDKKHPLAGGAETVNEELAKRLAQDGHNVLFLVGGFKGGTKEEEKDGYKIIRLGNRWTVYWQVYRYYKKNLQGWADLVIDEINTIPFFAKFYVKPLSPVSNLKKPNSDRFEPSLKPEKEKNILFVHQLCRKIWFYQMFFPLNLIGYLLEPIYLRILNNRKVITVSESTKKDLMKLGFNENKIKIISEGIEIELVDNLKKIKKYEIPTILSLGSVRAMKRTDQIVKAFEIAKINIPELELLIAGDYNDKFGRKVCKMAKNSKRSNSIKFLGRVSKDKKIELMQRSHLMCVTSVKEGWGLIVTEANSQGTPAVVYNVDGLRDSVQHNKTGLVCQKNTPENLAKNIEELLKNKEKEENLRKNAWHWSKEITFEKSYKQFVKSIKS